MKRGTPRHPKVTHLRELLNIGLAQAVGYLELLWHFTAEFCPQGDIGKFSDERIEAAIGWTGKRGRLVGALQDAGWLDPHPQARRVVHGWAYHADDAVRKRLQRAGLSFLSVSEEVTGHRRTSADNGCLPVARARSQSQSQSPPPPSEPADGSHEPEPHTRAVSLTKPVLPVIDAAPAKDGWEQFQNSYPEAKRAVRVDSACRAYVSVIHGKSGEHEKLMAGLSRYLVSAQWQRALADDPGGRFIPTMERFLTDRLYLDHPPAAEEASDGYLDASDPEVMAEFNRRELGIAV
jgi:hypothetical protein